MAFKGFKILVFLTGWLFACLLTWHFRERLLFRANSWFCSISEKSAWEKLLQTRETNLRQLPWRDERPLILMLGDSHVEMGAWYDLFRGHFAIQNAGLSQAKIQDVRRLAETISGIQPKRVVLMCGINDLGTGRAMEVAFRDYAQLLEKIRTNITADRVLVLSIMPVTPQRIADGSTDLNAKVKALNARLHEHCDRVGINYLDVSSAVSDNEGLRQELSWDGLHLNPTGYRKLADRMESFLEEKYDKAESK